MPRYLKTKYPCRECCEPAEVTRSSLAPLAICEPCRKRSDRQWRISYADKEAARLGREGNNMARSEPDRLAKWLRCVAAELEAAARCLDAVPDVRPHETLRMLLCTRSRLEMAEKTLPKVVPLLESAREEIISALSVDVVDGEGLAVEHPGPRAPALRVVK